MHEPDYRAVVIEPTGETREYETRIYLAPRLRNWYDETFHAEAVHIDRDAKRVWYERVPMT